MVSFLNLRKVLGLDYLSKDEMTELLDEDLELFTQVAEAFDSLQDEGIEYGHIERDMWLLSNKCSNYADLKRGLIVVANPEFEWNDERITRLNNSKPWKVLNKWDIEDIEIYNNSVVFYNRINIIFGICLVYCKDGVPNYEYFYNIKPIRENWYYCYLD